jgi:hypothetical protein
VELAAVDAALVPEPPQAVRASSMAQASNSANKRFFMKKILLVFLDGSNLPPVPETRSRNILCTQSTNIIH